MGRGYFFILICFLLFSVKTNAQEFLQLETKNDPSTIKYPIGSTIKIKKLGSKEWSTIKILGFSYADTSIVYEEGKLSLSTISEVQRSRPGVSVAGKMLMVFGTTWLTYGAIAGELDKDPVSGYSDLAIGVSTVALGLGLNTFFKDRKFKIGTRYRLRLIDLRL